MLSESGVSSGDVIVQDEADSAVGLAVVQMANAMGVKTINVISKPYALDYESAAAVVKGMGGDIVVNPSYLRSGVSFVQIHFHRRF